MLAVLNREAWGCSRGQARVGGSYVHASMSTREGNIPCPSQEAFDGAIPRLSSHNNTPFFYSPESPPDEAQRVSPFSVRSPIDTYAPYRTYYRQPSPYREKIQADFSTCSPGLSGWVSEWVGPRPLATVPYHVSEHCAGLCRGGGYCRWASMGFGHTDRRDEGGGFQI